MTRYLRQAGVTTETLVAIAMERSLEMVAGLLAILEAGGAYLPIDPGLPPARLAFLLEDARPAIILTQESVLGHLPRWEASVVIYDDAPKREIPPDKLLLAVEIEPDNLAYVLYTSGSTAKPKAVEITQRSLVNLLAAMQRDLAFEARDSFLAVTTLSFDIAALELFLPLLAGGRLVIASREDAADPWRLLQLLDRSGCTTMQATPATWRGLVGAGRSGDRRLKILCGGEALPTDLAAALLGRGSAVSNMYGPTETTIWSLRHEVGPADDPVPIGRPLSNTRVYVLDGNRAPVPDGVAGELYIGGAGLARGYRNDPALTAERFVSCPFLPGERLYRTGDTVRYRRDGSVEFLGRVDNQVKVRGFRVGLEEVESAIAQHPEIAATAVQGVRDAAGGLRPVAYGVGRRMQD